MMRRTCQSPITAILIIVAVRGAVGAQVPVELMPSDTAQIRLLSFRLLAVEFPSTLSGATVVWVPGQYDKSLELTWTPDSEAVWNLWTADLDNVRLLPMGEIPFECPGEASAGFISPCPIQDDGVLLDFGPIERLGSVIKTVARVTNSVARGGKLPWLFGGWVVVELRKEEDGTWVLNQMMGPFVS